jgi:hypothetical protein
MTKNIIYHLIFFYYYVFSHIISSIVFFNVVLALFLLLFLLNRFKTERKVTLLEEAIKITEVQMNIFIFNKKNVLDSTRHSVFLKKKKLLSYKVCYVVFEIKFKKKVIFINNNPKSHLKHNYIKLIDIYTQKYPNPSKCWYFENY